MRAIILDRDGVINHDSIHYIKSPHEWQPIPGSMEAIAALHQAGFAVFVATNQSGVARGYFDLPTLELIHQKMRAELNKVGGKITEIFCCIHHPEEACLCRKPKPGLIHQIQQKYAIIPEQTYFVGDSLVDIYAAKAAACKPLLVLTGKGKITQERYSELHIPHFADLKEAVNYVLKQ